MADGTEPDDTDMTSEEFAAILGSGYQPVPVTVVLDAVIADRLTLLAERRWARHGPDVKRAIVDFCRAGGWGLDQFLVGQALTDIMVLRTLAEAEASEDRIDALIKPLRRKPDQ